MIDEDGSFQDIEKLDYIVRLFDLAAEIFNSADNASKWLNMPSMDFEGKTPLEYADTEINAKKVETVLEQIADGVIF